MEHRTLELTILSADDLRNVNFFGKMNVYVVVLVLDWAEDPNYRMKKCLKEKTPVDGEGHRNPTWNFTIKFEISEIAIRHNRISLLFQIRSRRIFPFDKIIGEVYVPLSNLIPYYDMDSGKATIVSYQVSKPSGRPKGVLNFSYRFPDLTEGNFPINLWTGEGKGEYLDQGYPTAIPLYGMPGMLYPSPSAASGYLVPGYGYPVSQEYGYGYGYAFSSQQIMVQDQDRKEEKEKEKEKDREDVDEVKEKHTYLGMARGVIVGLVAVGALAGIAVAKMVSGTAFDDGGFGLWS